MPAQEMNPREWPLWWRIFALINIGLYNFIGNVFAAGITPLFGLLVKDLHCTIDEASRLSTYALLCLGLSNLIALPAAGIMGMRYSILISLVVFFGVTIWAAEAPSYNSLFATRFVGGFAAGIIEGLGPRFIYAMFPEEHLSKALVVYASSLAAGSILGPFFSGLIAGARNDWRWFFWALCAITGGTFVGSFIMLPEPPEEYLLGEDAMELSEINMKGDFKPTVETTDFPEPEPELSSSTISLWRTWLNRSFYIPSPSRKAFAWNPKNTLYLLSSPQIFVTILLYGEIIGWMVACSIVLTSIFQSPPHLWSTTAMGNFNLSSLVGIVLGIPFGGPLSDWLSRRSIEKTGAHRPEARLVALIAPGIFCPLGLLIIAIYLGRDEIWIAEAVGVAMLAFGASSAASSSLSYAVDSFPMHTGQISVLMNIFKNLFGFALSYSSISWLDATGPKAQFGTMAGVLWGTFLLVIPMYFFGAPIRVKIANYDLMLRNVF